VESDPWNGYPCIREIIADKPIEILMFLYFFVKPKGLFGLGKEPYDPKNAFLLGSKTRSQITPPG
jgi:hypothetical protein